MNVYIILGILIVGMLAFATWGHIQTYREWKQELREKEDVEKKVRVMIYGENNDS